MKLLERITLEPDKCGGRPCIRGLRIRVTDILGMLAEGVSHDEILRDFIWEHASTENAVIISKDEDFVDRWLLDKTPVAFVWIRKGNCSNRALLEWFEPL